MNGSNHLEESERRPFAFCPAELRKLADTLLRLYGGVDPVARKRELTRFFRAAGFDESAAAAQARLDVLLTAAAPAAGPAVASSQ